MIPRAPRSAARGPAAGSAGSSREGGDRYGRSIPGRTASGRASWVFEPAGDPRRTPPPQPDDPGVSVEAPRLTYLDRAARRQGQGILIALALCAAYLLGLLTLPLVRGLFS